jgi:hypothetical protein
MRYEKIPAGWMDPITAEFSFFFEKDLADEFENKRNTLKNSREYNLKRQNGLGRRREKLGWIHQKFLSSTGLGHRRC